MGKCRLRCYCWSSRLSVSIKSFGKHCGGGQMKGLKFKYHNWNSLCPRIHQEHKSHRVLLNYLFKKKSFVDSSWLKLLILWNYFIELERIPSFTCLLHVATMLMRNYDALWWSLDPLLCFIPTLHWKLPCSTWNFTTQDQVFATKTANFHEGHLLFPFLSQPTDQSLIVRSKRVKVHLHLRRPLNANLQPDHISTGRETG